MELDRTRQQAEDERRNFDQTITQKKNEYKIDPLEDGQVIK